METTISHGPMIHRDPKSLSWKERAGLLFTNIGKHEVLLVAASLAYTTALAIAPFILILLSFASLLGESMQKKLYAQLATSMGSKAGETIQGIIERADNHPGISGLSGLIGFIVLAFSASTIFAQLRVALDKINEHQESSQSSGIWAFIKERFFSVGLVFGFAFLSIASLMATTVIAMVFEGTEGALWQAVSFAITFVVFSMLFAAIYRFVPSDTLSWRRCIFSGVVSAIFYIIGKTLIGVYLEKAGLESAYGAAGSLVVFLAWVYYTSLTILISYEFSSNFLGFSNEAKPQATPANVKS